MAGSAARRIDDAFAGRRPDRVPVFNQAIHRSVVSDVLGRPCEAAGGESRWASLLADMEGPQARAAFFRDYCRDAVEFALAVGEDMVRLNWFMSAPPNARRVGDNEVHWRSDDGKRFGRIVFAPESGTVDAMEDWMAGDDGADRLIAWLREQEAAYRGPIAHGPAAFADLAALIAEADGRLAVADSTGGLGIPMYEQAWLTAMLYEPDLVGRHVARAADQAIADLPAIAAMGVQVLNAGLDICYNGGPAYSPRLFERQVLPSLQRVTAAAHRVGLYYVYRTDGNTWPIADLLFVRSGADGAGEIDYQAGMRLAEMRAKMPHLTLVGNVDCAGVLVAGSTDDVRRQTQEGLEATGGLRHVVSASNLVMPGTPTANYLAMVKTAQQFEVAAPA
ncbi:MAG: hypothetical protein BIFFINMI_04098 [Phycisphaerae bacterium]|nr:hypothetical protein [Phycisphaerae bacterium]